MTISYLRVSLIVRLLSAWSAYDLNESGASWYLQCVHENLQVSFVWCVSMLRKIIERYNSRCCAFSGFNSPQDELYSMRGKDYVMKDILF